MAVWEREEEFRRRRRGQLAPFEETVGPATKEFGPVPIAETTAPEMSVTGTPTEVPVPAQSAERRVRDIRRELIRKQMARKMFAPAVGYPTGTEQASPFTVGVSAPLARWNIDEEDGYLIGGRRRRSPWEV